MEKPDKENIGNRLIFSFFLLILIFFIFGFYSLYSIRTISGLTRTIYNSPLVVSNAALQANVSITKMHRDMKDAVLFKSSDRIQQSIVAVDQQEKLVYQYLDIVWDRILGDEGKNLENESRTLFENWRPIRKEVIDLVRIGQRDKAAEITIGKGADHVAKLEKKMIALTEYARIKASSFMNEAEKTQSRLTFTTIISLIIFLTISCMIVFFTLKRTASTEKELRESKQLLMNAFDYAPIGMVLVEPGGKFNKVNEMFCEITGYSEKELSEMSHQEITHQDDYVIGSDTVKKLIEGKIDKAHFEKKYIKKDGDVIDVHVSTSLLRDSKGSPLYFFSQVQDITKRNRLYEALRESGNKYQALFHNAQVALFRTTIEGKLIEINKRYAQIAGYSTIEACMDRFNPGKAWADPDGRNELVKLIQEKGSVADYEAKIIRRDGTHIWILFSATVFPEQGFIEGSLVDISDRKQMEEELRQSETYLRTLINTIPDLVWLKDIQGVYLFCNSRFESLFGAKETVIIGKTDYDFVDKELADFFRENDKVAADKGRPVKNEEEVTFAEDGHLEILETIKTPIYRNDGQIDGILGIGRDITGRKQIEQDLQTRESFLRSVINQSPFAIWISDSKGTTQQANPALKNFLNLTDEQFIGQYNIFNDPFVERQGLMPLIRTVYEDGKTISFTCDWDGNEIPTMDLKGSNRVSIEANMFPIHDPAGKLTNVVLNWIDISDRKKAEEEILKLNRDLELRVYQRTAQLEEVNKELEDFVYSVSHDLRAPLRSISGFSEIINRRHKTSLNEEGQHYFDNIVKASSHMGELIDDLLKFSRLGRSSIKSEKVLLNDVFKTAMETLSGEIKKRGAQVNIPEYMPAVQGDLTLTTNAFINLMGNALKYHKPHIPPVIDIGFEIQSPYVIISVTDNGIGIDPAYHEKIFNMFQRLHSQTDYPGTGIGLAAVKKALQIMKGQVWVESEPDKGSIFKIKILMAKNSSAERTQQ